MAVVTTIPSTEPNPPLDPSRRCCGWCGCVLDEDSASEYFHGSECFRRWHEWRNEGAVRAA